MTKLIFLTVPIKSPSVVARTHKLKSFRCRKRPSGVNFMRSPTILEFPANVDHAHGSGAVVHDDVYGELIKSAPR